MEKERSASGITECISSFRVPCCDSRGSTKGTSSTLNKPSRRLLKLLASDFVLIISALQSPLDVNLLQTQTVQISKCSGKCIREGVIVSIDRKQQNM